MKENLTLVGVLTIICVISGFSLSFVYETTKGPIAEVILAREARAAATVLPGVEPHRLVTVPLPDETTGITSRYYIVASETGELLAAAIPGVSANGYSDRIDVLVGISTESNALTGIDILYHRETPGLGARIVTDTFRNDFIGLPLDTVNSWETRKLKPDSPIDGITAATISSRATVEAARNAVAAFLALKPRLMDAASAAKENAP